MTHTYPNEYETIQSTQLVKKEGGDIVVFMTIVRGHRLNQAIRDEARIHIMA